MSSRVGQNTSSISQLTNRLDNLDADEIGFESGSSGMQSTDVENAIIEAYNHGGSGGPVSADDVSFDPADTDLSSTNVEDVVKEVNDKVVDLDTSVSQLTQTVSGQGTNISGLQTSVSQLTQDVNTLNGRFVSTAVSLRGFYYGAGGNVEVPITLPTYNNTIIIASGNAINSFRISANGEITSSASTTITLTYSNNKLLIGGGNWYTGGLIIATWNAFA